MRAIVQKGEAVLLCKGWDVWVPSIGREKEGGWIVIATNKSGGEIQRIMLYPRACHLHTLDEAFDFHFTATPNITRSGSPDNASASAMGVEFRVRPLLFPLQTENKKI